MKSTIMHTQESLYTVGENNNWIINKLHIWKVSKVQTVSQHFKVNKLSLVTRVWSSLITFFQLFTRFLSDSHISCEQKSNLLAKKTESLPSLFCHTRPDWIAHGHSFVKRDGSGAMWANRSCHSLIKSNWAKRDVSDLLWGIKKWKKQWKTVKNYKKYEFVQANCSFLRAICLIMSESLMPLFCHERPE